MSKEWWGGLFSTLQISTVAVMLPEDTVRSRILLLRSNYEYKEDEVAARVSMVSWWESVKTKTIQRARGQIVVHVTPLQMLKEKGRQRSRHQENQRATWASGAIPLYHRWGFLYLKGDHPVTEHSRTGRRWNWSSIIYLWVQAHDEGE